MPNFLSLKYKFFAFFLAVAMIPLTLMAVLAFWETRQVVVDLVIDKLQSIADVQQRRLDEIHDSHIAAIKQMADSTTMHTAVIHALDGKSGSSAELSRAIQETQPPMIMTEAMDILDSKGNVLLSTDSGFEQQMHEAYLSFRGNQFGNHVVHQVLRDVSGVTHIFLLAPIIINNVSVASLAVLMNTEHIVNMDTVDYTGLGTTGEVILAQRNRDGDAQVITQLRSKFGTDSHPLISKKNLNDPVISALYGQQGTFINREVTDYRGANVFAVTRVLDNLGWVLVAKIDQQEALAPLSALFNQLWTILGLTTLLVIIMALWVSRLVYLPITELTTIAGKLEKGDFRHRAKVWSGDEIGLLAQTFNHMSDKLKDLYRTLESRVKERTKQLAESQARLETLFSTMPVGVLLIRAPHGTPVMINKYGEYLLGRTIDPKTGRHHSHDAYPISTEDDKPYPKNQLPMNMALEQGVVVTKDNMVIRRKDGTRMYIRATAGPIKSHTGKITSVVAVFEDITQLKEIDRAKTEFVSIASHQLRTPLTSINWYTEMLLAGDAGEISVDQKDYLQEIAVGNKRMLDLVNALLNVSRLELGTFLVEPEPTDIINLAKSVVGEEKPAIHEKHLAVQCEFAQDVPIIDLDPKLLRMILQNLLSNAVKYTPENGKIEFGIMLDKNKKNVMIRLADNGLGIPKDEQNHIFSKLFRANNVKITSAAGTGLGLYIVKSIVDHTNGKIWFESAENNGTTFYVTFPLKGMKKRAGVKQLS